MLLRARFAWLMIALAACSELASPEPDGALPADAAISPDAAPPADGGREDAGEALDAAMDAGATEDARVSTVGALCIVHTQCDDGQLCESSGPTSDRRCTVTDRPRGSAAFEGECASNDECASGFCWSTGTPGIDMRCSQSCASDEDCGDLLNRCVPYARTDFFFCDARL